MLALVVNFWDALDRKREMPIMPAAREVYSRDGDGQTWDVAIWVPKRFDPASYEWGSRPAMAGFWPGASLLWPVCERGQLSAVMPPGAATAPRLGRVPTGLLVLGPAVAQGRGALARGGPRGVVIIDGPGGLPARRLV